MKFISIVFPNWNGKEHSLRLLDSLEDLDYPKEKMEIICVDNGSNDGSQSEIRKKFSDMDGTWSRLLLIENEKNIGAAPAYNIGFRAAEKNFDFIWKLDNDIILCKDALNKLLEKFEENSKLGIVGSAVFPLFSYSDFEENFKGNAEVGCRINFLTTVVTKKEVNFAELKSMDARYRNIDYSIGCSNLISRKVFDTVGLLDEDFFLYYDDSYFAYRTRLFGFGLMTALDSIVFHKGSASTGGIMKPLGIYYTTLSELLFFKKAMNQFVFLFYYPFIIIKRFFLTALRLIRQKDFALLRDGIIMYFSANKKFLEQVL